MKQEILQNKHYLIFSLLTSIYVYLPHLVLTGNTKALWIFTLMLFLISKINKFLYLIVSYILIFFNIIFTHLYFHWGGVKNHNITARIETFQMAPINEIEEYLKNYINYTDLLIILYALIGIYLVYKIFRYQHSLQKLKKLAMLSFVTLFIFTILYRNPFIYIPPLNYVYKYIEAGKWKNIVKQRSYYIKKNHIKKEPYDIEYDKVIIVIGESASKNHMSLYGYNKETTPFFDILKKEGVTLVYNFNTISPANQTLYAIPMELTNATVEDFYNKFINSYSLVTDLKTYGYKTYWLSNQSTYGKLESYITSIGHEADFIHIENNEDWKSTVKVDKVLIGQLDSIKNKPLKEAYFFHLMGSHVEYTQRVEKDKTLFKNPENIIQKYDNTIFYTDYILSEIYKRFKNEKMLFVYFSDHAEVVSEKLYGHNFSPSYKEEYQVPFVVLSTVPNRRLLEVKLLNIKKIINLESMSHIIKYILGTEHNIAEISTKTNIVSMEPINKLEMNQKDYTTLKSHTQLQ